MEPSAMLGGCYVVHQPGRCGHYTNRSSRLGRGNTLTEIPHANFVRFSGRFARFESDRLYRLARVLALARESLGDEARATRWLKRTKRALGGVAPIAAIDTELGARQVENLLGRIAYGGIS